MLEKMGCDAEPDPCCATCDDVYLAGVVSGRILAVSIEK